MQQKELQLKVIDHRRQKFYGMSNAALKSVSAAGCEGKWY